MIIVTANLGLLSFPSEGQLHQARSLLEQRRRIDNLGRAVVLARRPSAMVCDATVVAVDSYRFGCRITPGLSGFFR